MINILVAKNAEGTKGKIGFGPITDKISRTKGLSNGADLYLLNVDANGTNLLEEFFGYIPSGILAEGDFLYMYCPQIYDTMGNYQNVNGIVYYAGGLLHIVPNTDTYKVFYGIEGCKTYITQEKIGLDHVLEFEFDIPKREPASYYNPLKGLDTKLDLGKITPRYSETADILFQSTMWDYDPDMESTKFRSFKVKFERDDNIGRITFKDIKWKAGDVTDSGGAITSSAFATHAKNFFGTMPYGLSMPFKSNTYIPNSETHSWFKTGVDSKMYFLGGYLLFNIEDEIYQKTKVYFCDIDGSTHEEIGMVGEYTLEFIIYTEDDPNFTMNSVRVSQTVQDAVAIKCEEDDE